MQLNQGSCIMYAVTFLCKKKTQNIFLTYLRLISTLYYIFFFPFLSVVLILKDMVHPDKIYQTLVRTQSYATYS